MNALETENIWEVGSSGSGGGLDDDLAKELEEMERREEEERLRLQKEQEQTSSNMSCKEDKWNFLPDHINSETKLTIAYPTSEKETKYYQKPALDLKNVLQEIDSTEPMDNTLEDAFPEDTENSETGTGDIVFKNTGVINVAHCNEIDDAYMLKSAGRGYGMSEEAAILARRERKRLYYHRRKMDPEFRAKTSEYRRRYKEKQKLQSGHSPNTDELCTLAAQSGFVYQPQEQQRASRLLSEEADEFIAPSRNIAKKRTFPVKQQASKSYKKFATDSDGDEEDPDEFSSDLSCSGSAKGFVTTSCDPLSSTETLDAMRMRFCGSNVVADGPISSSLYDTVTRRPSLHGPRRSLQEGGHAEQVIERIRMVSLRRFQNLQRQYRRMNSKLAYYQTVIRRDRAVIELMREQLHRAGIEVDYSHLKIPNFRLKYLDDINADVIQEIDVEEADAYERILGGQVVPCNDDHRESYLPQGSTLAENEEKCNGHDSSFHGCTAESSVPTLSSSSNFQSTAMVSFEKSSLLENGFEFTSSTPSARFRRNIAVKSSRGGLKHRQILLQGNGSLSQNYDYSTLQRLQELAEQEGRAFAYFKAQCILRIRRESSNLSSRSGSVVSTDSGSVSGRVTKFKAKSLCEENYSLPIKAVSNSRNDACKMKLTYKAKKSKSFSPKKLRDDQDDVYVPETPIDMSDTVMGSGQERDDDLYDIVVTYKQEDDQQLLSMLSGNDMSSGTRVSAELRRKVCVFLDEATAFERLVFGSAGGGDTASEEGSSVSEFSDLDNVVVGKKTRAMELCGDEASLTSRDGFLDVLYRRFRATHRDPCTLKMFIECLPKAMVRRNASNRGYTSCLICGTPELLYENLVAKGIIDFKADFENIALSRDLQEQLKTCLDNVQDLESSVLISSWSKSSKGQFAKATKSSTETVGDVVNSLRKELHALPQHLNQVASKYAVIRAALNRSSLNGTAAMVHVTWVESPKVYHRSINRLIMSDICLSVLSGHVWTAKEEYAFASVSDQKEHSTSALWAHLEEPLNELVEQGYKRFYIISDSAVNQFRNKANFYYMNEFAVKKNVEFRWIFLSCYHSHLPADIFGQKLKESIERNTLSDVRTKGDNVNRSAASIIQMLRLQFAANTRFYFVSCEEVTTSATQLPALQSIKGTSTFSEVFIAPGKFFVKLDSLDEFWTKVLIIF